MDTPGMVRLDPELTFRYDRVKAALTLEGKRVTRQSMMEEDMQGTSNIAKREKQAGIES